MFLNKISATLIRVSALIDYNIHNTLEKQHEFRKEVILADVTLTEDEKSVALNYLNQMFDNGKINYNEGTKRICENCQEETLATLYCEHCIRNCLKATFSSWTSGNNCIDNLIQYCQMKVCAPYKIAEWIPYNKLQKIEYLTKGGCSEIYAADWIDGLYYKVDNQEQQLKRIGICEKVILKRLKNVENAKESWFEEGKSHLTISNKWDDIVKCYGLTKDPENGSYMLVLQRMNMDLRKYLQENHHKLTWKERINVMFYIVMALSRIHNENAIHRDLHSGNILQLAQSFFISDLGFCGPADKPLNSLYGNLPYIAPEVIAGKETTFASDIYSFAMLMWEISSGQPPFVNYEHNYDLALKVINGMRPKVMTGTPLEYRILMEQCWDADPSKRPNIVYIYNEFLKIKLLYHQYENNEQQINDDSSVNSIARKFSKVHIFEDLPEPRNATEAFHNNDSMQHNLSIPHKIEDITEQNNSTKIDDKNEVKGKSKRIYSDQSDDDEKKNLTDDNFKKVKLNNNEGGKIMNKKI
ncbi:kinase-like domain-containing protein [Glomus cerebriforme]|uniref:Kinase-like domain-containing protein n=1 Tax=Glomus cerebriforme TaxID=658196 RepID=A0A397SN75_9GLOM|nr:kinase-like domain-containing protein [Glomus cerebriforme]